MGRRGFLGVAAAGAAAALWPTRVALAQPRPAVLRAVPASQRFGGGPATEVWTFNGAVPGPMLRYRRGERLRIEVRNELRDALTVHWHGLRVPNAMDGVPHLTQPPIAPGGRFLYEFDLNDSGTFWYHPHTRSFEHVARGLYGPLVVEEESPPAAEQDLCWVLSDLRLDAGGAIVDDFGAMRELSREGRIGNRVLVNGVPAGAARIEGRGGERVRLRLVNAATARYFQVAVPAEMAPRVMAFDGHAVVPHAPESDGLLLGPGERVDLLLDLPAKPGARLPLRDRWKGPTVLGEIAVRDEPPLRAEPLPAPPPLERNDLPEPDLLKPVEHEIVFQGGGAGPPVIGLVDGKRVPIHELMRSHKLAWTLNAVAASETATRHEPLLRLKRNTHCLLRMVNETAFVHPMHLHGYAFKVIRVNRKAPRHAQWRDTITLGPFDTVEVAFVADNPGEWMFHCHILEHAASGMMGTLLVD